MPQLKLTKREYDELSKQLKAKPESKKEQIDRMLSSGQSVSRADSALAGYPVSVLSKREKKTSPEEARSKELKLLFDPKMLPYQLRIKKGQHQFVDDGEWLNTSIENYEEMLTANNKRKAELNYLRELQGTPSKKAPQKQKTSLRIEDIEGTPATENQEGDKIYDPDGSLVYIVINGVWSKPPKHTETKGPVDVGKIATGTEKGKALLAEYLKQQFQFKPQNKYAIPESTKR